MRSALWALPVLILSILPFPALCQSSPKQPAKEQFFLQASGGTFLYEAAFQYFPHRPITFTGLPSEEDTVQTGPMGFTPSLAAGMDLPDHFSFFAKGDWRTPMGSDILLGSRYTIFGLDWMRPYFQAGVGLNFSTSLGPAFQLGFGLDFPLALNADVLAETNLDIAYTEWNNPTDSTLSYQLWGLYLPVSLGVKYRL